MHAVQAALWLYAHPNTRRDPGTLPLPHGMVEVLKLAARSSEALGRWSAEYGADEEQLTLAAVFFVEQALMARHASHYRVLGLEPDATEGQIRVHYRWLMRWLHPDKQSSGWHRDLAERVNRAYHELRNPFRRARYDATLGGSSRVAQKTPAPTSAAPPPVPRPVLPQASQPRLQPAPEQPQPVTVRPTVPSAPEQPGKQTQPPMPPNPRSGVQVSPGPAAQSRLERPPEPPPPAVARPDFQPTAATRSPPAREAIAESKAQGSPVPRAVTLTAPTPQAPPARPRPRRKLSPGHWMRIAGVVALIVSALLVLPRLVEQPPAGVPPVTRTPPGSTAPERPEPAVVPPQSGAPEPSPPATAAAPDSTIAAARPRPPPQGSTPADAPPRDADRAAVAAAVAKQEVPREPLPSVIPQEQGVAPRPAVADEAVPAAVAPPEAREIAQRFGNAYASGDLATVLNLLADSGTASAQELSATAGEMDRWRSQHGAAPLEVSRLEPVPTDDGAGQVDAVLLAPGDATLRLRLRETNGTWKVERLQGVETAP